MALPNIFDKTISDEVIGRIQNLTAQSQPLWGKMNVAQMLAHCNVTYEMIYEDKHPKPNFFMKFILGMTVKKIVISETPYKKNSPTGSGFLIAGERIFEVEKERLINYINKTQALGAEHFENKESLSFGKLNKTEWNNMLYKHLDHHLKQFGV